MPIHFPITGTKEALNRAWTRAAVSAFQNVSLPTANRRAASCATQLMLRIPATTTTYNGVAFRSMNFKECEERYDTHAEKQGENELEDR